MTAIEINLKENKQNLVIVGLGNIGKEYEQTRHNAGFIFIDKLVGILEQAGYTVNIKNEKEYIAYTCSELKLSLLKPNLLMNLSGKSVAAYYRYHKGFSAKSLIVVHDDLDLMLGDYKINIGKGPRLHNGLRSIESELSVSDFIRIRIGIENRQGLPISGLDYVLYKFTKDEQQIVNKTIEEVLEQRFVF